MRSALRLLPQPEPLTDVHPSLSGRVGASVQDDTSVAIRANPPVRPLWLWLVALISALGLHAALYVGVSSVREAPPPALDEVQLTLVARGEPVPEETMDQKEQIAAEPVVEPTPVPAPAMQAVPVDTAPLPDKPVEEAVALPVAPSDPPPVVMPPEPANEIPADVKPVEKVPDQPISPPVKLEDPLPATKAEIPPVHKPPTEVRPATKPAKPRPASQAHKVGTANGEAATTGQTLAAFSAVVVAEIRSHQFYPEAAHAKGIIGHVVVSFTIGRAGTVTSVTISQSSGHAELDDAARQALRAVHVPAPPDGTFSRSIPFDFGFR